MISIIHFAKTASLRLIIICTTLSSCLNASAQTPVSDVWNAYDSFNASFLDKQKLIYKNTSADKAAIDRWKGAAAIWCQPMFVDMAINAAILARKNGEDERAEDYSVLARELLEGNIRHYVGFDFDDCNTNTGWFIYDDIQWWTITLARAAKFFNDDRYRQMAARSFARVWYGSPRVADTGAYADPTRGLGGGMFWQWQPIESPQPNIAGHGKMSCINFPTVIAAMLLYDITPDSAQVAEVTEWENESGHFIRRESEVKSRYLDMAKEIYHWSVKNLSDSISGMVYDHRHGQSVGGHPLLYNQGTYIGASALLYLATGDTAYMQNATNAADYSVNVMSSEHSMLPWAHNPQKPYDQGSLEQGIYPAIWGQYMALLINECGQRQYLPFIRRNIAEGWKNRDVSRNICDGESWAPTPEGSLIGSYAASSVPSLMLLFQ